MKFKLIILLIWLWVEPRLALAQPTADVPKHSPKKATLLSLFPGGGQIYNQKYWKLPIIYGGFAVLTYAFVFNQNEYDRFKIAYSQAVSNQTITDPELANVPIQMLYNVREAYRESRDLSIIGMAGLYALNLVDAAVDAHFKTFNVSENLSLKAYPGVDISTVAAVPAIKIKLNLH